MKVDSRQFLIKKIMRCIQLLIECRIHAIPLKQITDKSAKTVFKKILECMGTWCTKQLIEGCLLRRLWINAIITNAPEGGTTSASLLNFLAKAAARYAGRSGDFRQESRSYSKINAHHQIVLKKIEIYQHIPVLFCDILGWFHKSCL